MNDQEQIGTNDLRFTDGSGMGFHHVVLSDVDDGDVIVINEDDIVPLIVRLIEHVVKYNISSNVRLLIDGHVNSYSVETFRK